MNRRLLCLALCPLLPAQAEIIYMKNGSRYDGRILLQTKDVIKFQMPGENGEQIDIPKITIEEKEPPSQAIAFFTGVSVPGGGQLYLGQTRKAAFYGFLTMLGVPPVAKKRKSASTSITVTTRKEGGAQRHPLVLRRLR